MDIPEGSEESIHTQEGSEGKGGGLRSRRGRDEKGGIQGECGGAGRGRGSGREGEETKRESSRKEERGRGRYTERRGGNNGIGKEGSFWRLYEGE